MRLLVCGSRAWASEEQYHRVVDEIVALGPALVMHGGAKGADECADLWCRTPPTTTPLLVFRADWHHDGKAAGPIRNARMLAEGKPDRGLAFGALWKPDQCSECGRWPAPSMEEQMSRVCAGCLVTRRRKTGTGDMVAKMLRAGLPVRWIATADAFAVDLVAMPPPPRGDT